MERLMLFLLLPLLVWSQHLVPLVPEVAANGGGVLRIVLREAPEKPIGIQWDLVYSPANLQLDPTPSVLQLAAKAGKSVSCSGRWAKAPYLYALRCILVGGTAPLDNGELVAFSFRGRSPVSQEAVITIDNVEEVTATSRRIKWKKSQIKVSVPSSGSPAAHR